VAKLYHKGTAKPSQAVEPDALLRAIEAFLSSCRSPAVIEYGEEITRLTPGQYALELRAGRVWIELWCETRSISRRILAIERQAIGVLDCAVQRFGGKSGRLSFLDLDRPQSAHRALCGTRQSFSEQFPRMLPSLQPFFISAFFRQAFEMLGGLLRERERDRDVVVRDGSATIIFPCFSTRSRD